MDARAELERATREVGRDDVPALLGWLTELEARLRLRLAEPVPTAAATSRTMNAAEAAAIAGTSSRWLLRATRGLKLRCDLSRKQARFDETGLRAWLAGRRG